MARPHRAVAKALRRAYWRLREAAGWGMPRWIDRPLDLGAPTRILHLRTDAIGDHLLSAPLLSALRILFPEARLEVACPTRVAPLFEGDPRVDAVLAFDRALLMSDRAAIHAWVEQAGGPWDLILCPVLSREPLSDHLLRLLPAARKVGFAGDLANQPDAFAEWRGRTAFTDVLEPIRTPVHELEQHGPLLSALGWSGPAPDPSLELTHDEWAEAEAWLDQRGLKPGAFLALGLGAQDAIREYPAFGEALRLASQRDPLPLLALGAEGERPRTAALLESAGLPWVDGLGALPLRQVAAVLGRAAAFVGVDSALAHFAIAAERPSLIVLGGGHFGRFQPWGRRTAVVTRPLPCFQCRWHCPFPEPTCIRGLTPELVADAILRMRAQSDEGPRVFHPAEADPGVVGPHAPGFRWLPIRPGMAVS